MPHPGQTLLHYTIVDKLGEGGMGVVWRALDTSLDREVALKVLPEAVADDTDRLARFEREARLLASLDHPNIATIHGLFEADGVRFLAMELVEGDDLSDRITQGPLPRDTAYDIAGQLALALESAHGSGVVHRDLKPANIKIGSDGRVKVLDFGLAKAWEGEAGNSSLSLSPTLTRHATVEGVILGTAAYMSPEQARGQAVDKRSDIWSFGCVLYEMLTARQLFTGETVSDTIAAILRGEPDWSLIPDETPSSIRRLLGRCLTKDRRRRLRDMGDAVLEIEAAGEEEIDLRGLTDGDPPRAHRRSTVLPWIAFTIVAIAFAVLQWAPWKTDSPPAGVSMTLQMNLPDDAPLAPAGAMPFGLGMPAIALTSDGSRLVYVALVDGRTQLRVRDMKTGEINAIEGTEGGFGPFLSPDDGSIAYFADEKLKRVPIDGGRSEVIAEAVFPYGGTWAPDGTIFYAPKEGEGISRVASSGGAVERVTTAGGSGHTFPDLLPDGRTLLVSNLNRNVLIVDLEDPDAPQHLMDDAGGARYLSTGHLVFARNGGLYGVGFDLDNLRITGEPAPLIHGIRSESSTNAQYTIAENGTLVYAPGFEAWTGFLTWVSRDGRRERLDLPRQDYGSFSISPDGRRLAVPITDGADQDIWIHEFDRIQTPTRLTFGMRTAGSVWTADNAFLILANRSADSSTTDLLAVPTDGNRSDAIRLATHPGGFVSPALTPDNREVLFAKQVGSSPLDLWRVQVEFGEGSLTVGEETPVLTTPHLEIFPAISPDGRWIAYTSDETGRWEIYVAGYPEFEHRVRVSNSGGEEARWTADGSELIYRWGSQWFSARVLEGPAITFSQPEVIVDGPFINPMGYSWDLSPDGERFLLIEGPEQDLALTELEVVTRFFDRLE